MEFRKFILVLCGKKGWMRYSDETIKKLCKDYLDKGFDAFKVKVGQDIDDDIRRCKLIREAIGWKNTLVKKICSFFKYFDITQNVCIEDG